MRILQSNRTQEGEARPPRISRTNTQGSKPISQTFVPTGAIRGSLARQTLIDRARVRRLEVVSPRRSSIKATQTTKACFLESGDSDEQCLQSDRRKDCSQLACRAHELPQRETSATASRGGTGTPAREGCHGVPRRHLSGHRDEIKRMELRSLH